MPDTNHIRDLQAQLQQFTGSEVFYRYHSRCLLTAGAHYLAEHDHCFWLLDVFASHLAGISEDKYFTQLYFQRVTDSGTVTIDDGNSAVLAEQYIPYTDFPLAEIRLYGCWSGDHWVIMLPGESTEASSTRGVQTSHGH